MKPATHPLVKDLVLIGGGHSHAIALRLFGMKPLPGLRLTLISDTSHTPYSGMLPGHVAGFYDFDDCHIDLRCLAQFAQAQFYLDHAVGLDLEKNKVLCTHHPPVAFDVLSIDIGSTPAQETVTGVAEYAIPAKPVPQFLQQWNQLLEEWANNPQSPLSLGIVGGGAGGVELAMAMQRRLHQQDLSIHPLGDTPPASLKKRGSQRFNIHLFHRGTELMPSHNPWVRRHLQGILRSRGIQVHLGETVCEVFPDKIQCESGLTVDCHSTFWVTQASAPSWIGASGLQTDFKGFVLVKDTLQSLSHPHIFAAGDIATMINHPRPKAGVFAVRQGKPLFENLRAILLGQPLKTYQPQRFYLSLIGTGDRNAIASWGSFGCQSRLLWRWKDHIDRQFMDQFKDFPKMEPGSKEKVRLIPDSPPPMYCAGCGSKVGSTTLERVLQRLQREHPAMEREDIILGLGTPDDAAVVKVRADQWMVHTVDYFRALINDPFIVGQISTNHCLSDIFAMGATPQSVLAIVTVPYGTTEKVEETLYQLLSGAMRVLSQSQTPLVGGHTTEGPELAFGLSGNGLVTPSRLLRKGGMKPGQVLILTKAIGTGILAAADMRLKAKGRWIDGAIESMLRSNQDAARVLVEQGATACTDVTGFGLLGHLLEMIQASGVAIELNLDAIPVLEGVREMLELGIVSSLQSQNLKASQQIDNLHPIKSHPDYPVLFDPQTSGGLVATISVDQGDNCQRLLQGLGYNDSQIIGQVIPAQEGVKPITIISEG